MSVFVSYVYTYINSLVSLSKRSNWTWSILFVFDSSLYLRWLGRCHRQHLPRVFRSTRCRYNEGVRCLDGVRHAARDRAREHLLATRSGIAGLQVTTWSRHWCVTRRYEWTCICRVRFGCTAINGRMRSGWDRSEVKYSSSCIRTLWHSIGYTRCCRILDMLDDIRFETDPTSRAAWIRVI